MVLYLSSLTLGYCVVSCSSRATTGLTMIYSYLKIVGFPVVTDKLYKAK